MASSKRSRFPAQRPRPCATRQFVSALAHGIVKGSYYLAKRRRDLSGIARGRGTESAAAVRKPDSGGGRQSGGRERSLLSLQAPGGAAGSVLRSRPEQAYG